MRMSEAIYALNTQIVRIDNNVAYDINGNEIAYDKVAAEALMAAEAYKEKRAKAYPSIVDQLDTLYHGGYDAWKASIQTIKDQFPKG